jgi:hypothetical protein
MNRHFNLSRFGRLLRRHTFEHLRSYLMGAAVLTGVIFVVLGGLTYLMHRPLGVELQSLLFVAGLVAAGGIFTSSVFAALGDARQAAPLLLLPASHLEKYLVAWLYSLPVFLLVYLAAFFAVDALVLSFSNPRFPHLMLDFKEVPREGAVMLLSFMLVHSIALWGAVYFRRLHVIKTAFSLFGALLLLALINYQMVKALLTSVARPTLPFGNVFLPVGEQSISLGLPDEQGQWLLLLPLALALLLWAGAYARLTETQL